MSQPDAPRETLVAEPQAKRLTNDDARSLIGMVAGDGSTAMVACNLIVAELATLRAEVATLKQECQQRRDAMESMAWAEKAVQAEVATLRAELDEARKSYETMSANCKFNVVKRGELEARLAAQAEALETLEQEMRARVVKLDDANYWDPMIEITTKWADQLAAVRTTAEAKKP